KYDTGFGQSSGSPDYVKLDTSIGDGSGKGDMYLDVPVADFDLSASGGQYVVLYSQFGYKGDGADGDLAARSGFEEWCIQQKGKLDVTTRIDVGQEGPSEIEGISFLDDTNQAYLHDSTQMVITSNPFGKGKTPTPTGTVTYDLQGAGLTGHSPP